MKTWQTVNRSKWQKNMVSDKEPDKAQWIDEKSGLDCLIVRNHIGGLCGYVGVPPTHKYYELSYDEVDADVHGGLTFSNFCDPSEKEDTNICHTGDIANPKVWWLGFDCVHGGDDYPTEHFNFPDNVYRNFEYVKTEVEKLAEQLN